MSQFTAKPLLVNISGSCAVNFFIFFLIFAFGSLEQIHSIEIISNEKKMIQFSNKLRVSLPERIKLENGGSPVCVYFATEIGG